MSSTTAPSAPATSGIPDHAERLWDAVIGMDEHAALAIVLDALAAGIDAEAVLLDIIGAVQHRVGVAWAADHISVAQEHAATAINERVIAGLVGQLPPVRRAGPRVTVACVDGEWHALPARLLAEVLGVRGFRVDYLGAQVPTPHLIKHLHRTNPDVVALSSSLPTRLPTAHATMSACQNAGVPVIVGGAAFGPDGRYARALGAQAWASDARAAADRLSGEPLPRPRSMHQVVDDLPHLADQEYTLVTRRTPELVRTVLTALEERVPAMRGYTDQQRLHTAEDLRHLVEFLAAALYVADASLYTTFLTWTADVLAARGVPPQTLTPALDLIAAELRDFPRAGELLAAGRTALDAHVAAEM